MSETANTIVTEETTEAIVTEEAVEETKCYTLSSPIARDIYPVSKILSKIGIKEFKQCFESEAIQKMILSFMNGKEDKEDLADEEKFTVGMEIVFAVGDVILGNLSSCEEHVNQLLSNLSGMSKKEISSLPLATYAEMIIDVIKLDGFKDFVQAVSKLKK